MLKKVNVIENLIKRSQNFIFGPNAEGFAYPLTTLLPNGKHSSTLDDPPFFYKCKTIFSKDFKNFHAIFNSHLSKLFLSFFDIFLNSIIEFTGHFSGFVGYPKNWKI